jgi:hypothetical protein
MLFVVFIVSLIFIFLDCRSVGRFRSDFNHSLISAVKTYRTCRFIEETVRRVTVRDFDSHDVEGPKCYSVR